MSDDPKISTVNPEESPAVEDPSTRKVNDKGDAKYSAQSDENSNVTADSAEDRSGPSEENSKSVSDLVKHDLKNLLDQKMKIQSPPDDVQLEAKAQLVTGESSTTDSDKHQDKADGNHQKFAKKKITCEDKFAYHTNLLQIGEPLIYDKPTLDQALDEFPAWKGFRPSALDVSRDKISHLVVISPYHDVSMKIEEEIQKKVEAKFKQMPEEDVSTESVLKLSAEEGLTQGKWIVFLEWGQVDNLWKTLVENLFIGGLPHVFAIKANPKDFRVENVENPMRTTISVFTKDFRNQDEIRVTAKLLRRLGVKNKMIYKPNVYSVIGIYSGNKYGIKPYLQENEISQQPSKEGFHQSRGGLQRYRGGFQRSRGGSASRYWRANCPRVKKTDEQE